MCEKIVNATQTTRDILKKKEPHTPGQWTRTR